MFAGEAAFDVAGEAANVVDALAFSEQLQPDVVLLDIRMAGQDGLGAIASIHEVSPATKIIMFTISDDPTYVRSAIKAGATGYLLKEATRQEMLDTVRRVLHGETMVDPKLTLPLAQMNSMGDPLLPLRESLTPRETDVLRLIAGGQTNPEIAAALGIGKGTVKSHVASIIAKLDVTDRTQAAVRAVQLGLVEVDPPNVERPDVV